MGGDFNKVLKDFDKFRDNIINHARTNQFWNCINQCNLIDSGFKGSKYTSTNKRYRQRNQLILERIDRCLANDQWIEAFVAYLPRTHSNYCPSFTPLKNNLTLQDKLFRMEIIQCSYLEFP